MRNSTIQFSFLILALSITVSSLAQQDLHVYSSEIPWSETTPIEEAGKIYSITEAINSASAGDIIWVHEGIYREKVVVNKNNLAIKSFENDYVLVTGAEVVEAWNDATGMNEGVKVADISSFNIETDYTQLFADGNIQMMARHPNNTTGDMMDPMNIKSGYAPLSNVYKDAGVNATGHATFEDTTLPDVDLSGGIFRGLTGKMRQYVYGDITNKNGNTVSFKAMNNGDWKNEAGFDNTKHKFSWGFVMHKNLIDYPGEWFADGDELYYLPSNAESFDDTRIEIQVREKVLVLNNTSGVSIKGLHFVAGNMDIQNATGATIENGSIRYVHPLWIPKGYGQGDSDPKGIYLRNSSNNTFKDLHVAHSWGNMFSLKDGQNNSFQNCIIEDFGWVGIFTSGVHVNTSDKTNINNCTFGDACRFQIRIDGGDAQVNIMDCDFYGSMKLGEDAGPIEATSTGKIATINLKDSEIAYNKVHDVVGVPVSSFNYKRVKATAFYMEDVENYTAHHNLVYNIKHTVEHDFEIEPVGEFLYLGPRYNAMHLPVNYYNNTIWNVDENIGIWNIEIANWEELGIPEADNTGMIDDGHFVNNIFMNGPGYKISYNRQTLTSTGGKITWEEAPAGSSLSTHDFNEYVEHCAEWGYHFNPETNQFLDFDDAASNFVDAANGDFSLKTGSAAKASGTELSGYTNSATPDCGALEGGDRVLNAGATLTIPNYKEVTEIIPDEDDTDNAVNPIIRDNTVVYPNPVADVLYIKNALVNFDASALHIYSVSGNKVSINQQVQYANGALQVDVSQLATGLYFAQIDNEGEAYRFKFIKK